MTKRTERVLCLRCNATHRHVPNRCRCGAHRWADYEQFLVLPVWPGRGRS